MNMSWKDREALKILVDEINNENIVFGTNYNGNSLWYMCYLSSITFGTVNT